MSLEIHDVARIKGLLRLPVHTIVGLYVTSRRQCRWPKAKAFLSLVSSAFGRTRVGLRPTKRSSPSQARKNLWCPGQFSEDDRTDKNFIAPLRMHFQRSKSTLDNLKSVFKLFKRKLSLGAPGPLSISSTSTVFIMICQKCMRRINVMQYLLRTVISVAQAILVNFSTTCFIIL